MSDLKRIICLANSRKLSGRCIAGREWSEEHGASSWVRPVSDRENQEVSERERQYEDGSDPQVLDIIDIPVLEHQPKDHQYENWLLDPESYWIKVGTFPRNRLPEISDSVAPLWIDGESTSHGTKNKIPLEKLSSVPDSLRLIYVESMTISVTTGYNFSKRRVDGQFRHAGSVYKFGITDPKCETKYLAKPNGNYELGNCYLTISLGEPFQAQNAVFKLIAAVIEVE